MQWRSVRLWLVALLAVAAASAVWAQGSTGAIMGKVVDEKGEAIPGAQITITSTYLQGAKGSATNADGEFLVPYLPPAGDYKVAVEAAGYNKVIQSNVVVSLGSTTTMNIGLMAGGQEITVTARPPALATKDTKISTNLTQAELETIPLGRSYQDVLYLAPSVVNSGSGGNPGVSGSSSAENIYLVNGLNTTDPVTGTFGSNLNYNFIREMEVSTGGLEAEYGGSTGGLFNVLTKSGTNEFHGEVFGYYSNQNFNAQAHSTDMSVNEPQPFHNYDYGFDLGGPIVKDKLWFFVGYNPSYFTTHVQGTDELTNIWNGRKLHLGYNYDSLSRNWFWSAKFNWRVTDKHSLELSLFGDPSRMWYNEGSSPTLNDISRMTRRYQNGFNVALRWFATWTPKVFMETQLGLVQSKLEIVPWEESGYGDKSVYSWDYSPTLSIGRGMGWIAQSTRDQPLQFSTKLTWLANKNEVKFGAEYQEMKWDEFYGPSGGQDIYVYLQNGDGNPDPKVPVSTNIHDYKYMRVNWLQNPQSNNKGRYYALFAQDKWSVTNYVTLSAGVRWERNELLPKSGQHWGVDSFSPRIGMTWDWAHNGRSKFYMNWGDYFERPPIAATNSMDPGHGSYQNRYVWGSKYAHYAFSSLPTYVYNDTKMQSTYEFLIGTEYELRPDLTLDVRATFRQLDKVFEDMGYIDAQGNLDYILMNPGSGQHPAEFNNWLHQTRADGKPFDYELGPNPIRNYSAYTVTLNKRFSNRWFLNANYTLAFLKGNYGGGGGYYGGDMNVSTAYDVPEAALNQNGYGWLNQDIRHQLKVQGSYKFDFGLVLGANFTYSSGRAQSQTTPYPYWEPYYGTIYYAPRGNMRLPGLWTLDIHAEYDIKIFKSDLAFFVDVFNVTDNQTATGKYTTMWKQPDYMTQIINGSWYADAANLDPNYGKTTLRQDPRSARVGVKWSF